MAKTSKKDFDLFKKECRKWADILGLKDHEFAFFHGCEDAGNRAEYFVNENAKIANVYFAESINDKTVKNIKQIAFHEVYEISLFDLRKMAMELYAYDVVDRAVHRIVRTMENVLFPKY